MEKYRVREAIGILDIGQSTFYRLVKKYAGDLGETAGCDERGTFITREGICVLASKIGKEEELAWPENQTGTTEEPERTAENQVGINENLREMVEYLKTEVRDLKKTAERKEDQLSKVLQDQAEERHRADTIIMNMSNQVKSQMMLLEDMRKDLEQVKQMKTEEAAKPVAKEAPTVAVKKSEKKAPRAKKSFGAMYRTFIEMFQPWKLREEAAEEKEAA